MKPTHELLQILLDHVEEVERIEIEKPK